MIQLGLCLEENNPDSWCNPNSLAIDSSCCLNFHSWEPKIHNIPIGHFRVPKTLTFKMRPSAQPFLLKFNFISMRMKSHFHTKGWALNYVLIQREHRSDLLIFVLWIQRFWVWNLKYGIFAQMNQSTQSTGFMTGDLKSFGQALSSSFFSCLVPFIQL